MTARRPTQRHIDDCFDQIGQLCQRLRILEPRVRRQATGMGRDGYSTRSGPTSSYSGGHGGGDPVGDLVALRLDRPRSDPHAVMMAKLHQARWLLEQAEAAFASVSSEPRVVAD